MLMRTEQMFPEHIHVQVLRSLHVHNVLVSGSLVQSFASDHRDLIEGSGWGQGLDSDFFYLFSWWKMRSVFV